MTSDRRTSACRRLFPEKATSGDSGNTAKDLLVQEIKKFCDKWNLDSTTGLPRPGPYEWRPVFNGPMKKEMEVEFQDNEDKGRQIIDGPDARVGSSCLGGKERGPVTNGSSFRATTSSRSILQTVSKRVDYQTVAASLETAASVDSDIYATSLPVSFRNTAKSLHFESRDGETPAEERSESSVPSHNYSSKERETSVVSSLSMTKVNDLLFSQIPRTSGTPIDDCIDTEETRHSQMTIKGQNLSLA